LPATEKHVGHSHHIGVLNLAGDALHNFLDGLIIAASYFVSIPVGIATTVAVIFHEIPQEIADFGVLLYSGFSKTKALFYNFLSATTAIIGALVGLVLGSQSSAFVPFILPFSAGAFIYIAGSTLIPELQKGGSLKESIWHLTAMVVGILVMVALLWLE
jgi:zinc and cadmium transporter